jgi:hypothetical protein
MSERFSVATDILVNVVEKGTLDATAQGFKIVAQNVNIVNQAARENTQTTSSQSMSFRRLALDLRMLSIGLMILKREYGGINPIIDASISGMYTASAAVSVLIASTGILVQVWNRLGLQGKGLVEGIKGIGTALNAGTLSMMGYAAIAVVTVAAAVGIGTAVFEATSHISRLRTEIKSLQRDMEDLNSTMRNLELGQSRVTAEQSRYRYIIASLKREIELTGDPTGQLAVKLGAAEAAQEDLNVRSAESNWLIAQQRTEIAQTNDEIADYQELIKEAYRAPGRAFTEAGARLGRVEGEPGFIPEEQMGGLVRQGGIVGVEAGEVIMQREQIATMMAGYGGGGQISVSISLAGANITGVDDFAGALRRGGAEAAEEIRRLELLRRRTRSRF